VHPDISIFAIAALSVAILAVLQLAVWWKQEMYPGFGRWTAALVLISTSMFAIALKPGTMVWVLFIGPAAYAGVVLSLEACREFSGLRPRLWTVYAIAAVNLAAAIPLEIMRLLNYRIAVSSSFLAAIMLLCCITLLKNVPAGNSMGTRFTAGVFAMFAASSLVRAIYYLLGPHLTAFYDTTFAGLLSFGTQNLFTVGSMVGWLVMTNERRLADLKQQRAVSDSRAQQSAALDAKRTDLIGELGHEVRNPLAGLSAVMELMLNTELTAEQREYVLIADDSIEALLGMTEQILDLSKLESDQSKSEPSPFDLYGQLEGIVKLMKPLATAKGLDIVVESLSTIPPLVVGDAGRTRQVIMNLVGNAVKFTSRGQIRISAGYWPRSATQGELQVTVSDTGIGIAPQNISTLFEKKSAAHASTENIFGGSGIGLITCKNLIDLMGGQMKVESQAGQGTTFKLSLPMQVPSQVSSAAHS
jgi:signal transduction histidine kinase